MTRLAEGYPLTPEEARTCVHNVVIGGSNPDDCTECGPDGLVWRMGPGNGEDGRRCPNWSDATNARCDTVLRAVERTICLAGAGVLWECPACRYTITSVDPDETPVGSVQNEPIIPGTTPLERGAAAMETTPEQWAAGVAERQRGQVSERSQRQFRIHNTPDDPAKTSYKCGCRSCDLFRERYPQLAAEIVKGIADDREGDR